MVLEQERLRASRIGMTKRYRGEARLADALGRAEIAQCSIDIMALPGPARVEAIRGSLISVTANHGHPLVSHDKSFQLTSWWRLPLQRFPDDLPCPPTKQDFSESRRSLPPVEDPADVVSVHTGNPVVFAYLMSIQVVHAVGIPASAQSKVAKAGRDLRDHAPTSPRGKCVGIVESVRRKTGS